MAVAVRTFSCLGESPQRGAVDEIHAGEINNDSRGTRPRSVEEFVLELCGSREIDLSAEHQRGARIIPMALDY